MSVLLPKCPGTNESTEFGVLYTDYVHQIMKVTGLVHSHASMQIYLHAHACSQVFWMCVSVPVVLHIICFLTDVLCT